MFYRLARAICRFVLATLRRWETRGAHNIPPAGGLIVIANHVSYWDPVVVGCALHRRVYFMAKAELFKIPILGFIITRLGAFPVHRDRPDPAAIKRSLKLLKSGEVVGIFPEGTRSRSQELLDPHLGAAMLALKARVPVLPVAVRGTRGGWGKVHVNIGKVMTFDDLYGRKPGREEMERVSRRIMDEIDKLRLK